MKIAVLPGDGIGVEIVAEAVRVLERLRREGLDRRSRPRLSAAPVTTPPGSRCRMRRSSSRERPMRSLLGAVGGPQLRRACRARCAPSRASSRCARRSACSRTCVPRCFIPSSRARRRCKPEVVAGLDLMIVRELTGDIYFGQPRGRRSNAAAASARASTRCVYSEPEIRRIARVGFELARKRGRKLCSVDKANVLDTSILWREVVTRDWQGISRRRAAHMYVDNAAMQLVRNPKQFDVIVTGNHVRRHPVRRGVDARRLDRHAAVRLAGRERQGTLRADSRIGAGHRRAEQGQPAGDDPVAGDDVSPQLRPRRRSPRASSGRCARCSRSGLRTARHRVAGRSRDRGTRQMGDAVVAALHGMTPCAGSSCIAVVQAAPSVRDAEAVHATFTGAQGDRRYAAAALPFGGDVAQAARRSVALRLFAGRDHRRRSRRQSGPARRHGSRRGAGMSAASAWSVRDDRQRRGVGTALMQRRDRARRRLAQLSAPRAERSTPTISRRWRCIASSDSRSKALCRASCVSATAAHVDRIPDGADSESRTSLSRR